MCTNTVTVEVMTAGHKQRGMKFVCPVLTEDIARQIVQLYESSWFITARCVHGCDDAVAIEISCRFLWQYPWMVQPIVAQILKAAELDLCEVLIHHPLPGRRVVRKEHKTVVLPMELPPEVYRYPAMLG